MTQQLALLICPVHALTLHGVTPAREGTRWALIQLGDVLDVGRAAALEGVPRVQLDHPWISRHHMRIVRHEGAVYAHPLRPRGTIHINGMAVNRPQALQDGDELGLGGFLARVVSLDRDLTEGLDAAVGDSLSWVDDLALDEPA